MKNIKFDLKGGILGPDDDIEIDGISIPGIQKVVISSDISDAPRLNIFTVMPKGKIELDIYCATIHELEADGFSRYNYESLLKHRDELHSRCLSLEDIIEKILNTKGGKNAKS